MMPTPHEFVIGGVYMPPMLVAAFFGLLAALGSVKLINRFGLAKYFSHPPAVFLSLVVIYTIIIGTFFIGA